MKVGRQDGGQDRSSCRRAGQRPQSPPRPPRPPRPPHRSPSLAREGRRRRHIQGADHNGRVTVGQMNGRIDLIHTFTMKKNPVICLLFLLLLCAIRIRVKFNTYLGNCIFLFVYFVSKVNKVIRSQPKRGDSIFDKSRSFFISKLAKKKPYRSILILTSGLAVWSSRLPRFLQNDNSQFRPLPQSLFFLDDALRLRLSLLWFLAQFYLRVGGGGLAGGSGVGSRRRRRRRLWRRRVGDLQFPSVLKGNNGMILI